MFIIIHIWIIFPIYGLYDPNDMFQFTHTTPPKKTWKFTIEANRQMSPQGGKLGEMVQGEGPVPLST